MASNFVFLQVAWPEIYADCARTESYLFTDPRSACFYGRRSIELLVKHLYHLLQLPEPYKSDLAARTNAAGLTGNRIGAKLNLIRELGNTAVHDKRPIPPRPPCRHSASSTTSWCGPPYVTRPRRSGCLPDRSSTLPSPRGAAPLTAAEVQALVPREGVEEEMADVAIYLLHLANALDIDLGAAITSKMDRNDTRFAVADVHSTAPTNE